MTLPLAALSDAIARIAGAGAPLLTAIRIAPNKHVTGLLCPEATIMTTDQFLPALQSYTVVLPDRSLAPARPGPRNTASNLATLHLDAPMPLGLPEVGLTALGRLVVVLGADADASPTVRLTVIHRFLRTPEGPAAVLDLAADTLSPGSLVLDTEGCLVGLAAPGASGEVMVIPGASISRLLRPHRVISMPAPQASHAPSTPDLVRRGWLGVSLQPITVPDQLVVRAGQTSGRMVVNIATSGPADRAGVHVGDVLLSINGTSVSGQHTLRDFLAEERIGSTIEVKLLRDGTLMTVHLVVAQQP
ncbi:MAG: S1C family serine protease [Rhodopila sp.]